MGAVAGLEKAIDGLCNRVTTQGMYNDFPLYTTFANAAYLYSI